MTIAGMRVKCRMPHRYKTRHLMKSHVILYTRRSRRGHSFLRLDARSLRRLAVGWLDDVQMNSVRLFRSCVVSSLAVRMCSTKTSYEVRVVFTFYYF